MGKTSDSSERNMTTFENVKSALKFSAANFVIFFLPPFFVVWQFQKADLCFSPRCLCVYTKILLFAGAFLYSGQNTNVGYSCATVKDNERWVKREIYSGRRNCLERFCALTRFCIGKQKRKKNWNVLEEILFVLQYYLCRCRYCRIFSELLRSPYSGLFMPRFPP